LTTIFTASIGTARIKRNSPSKAARAVEIERIAKETIDCDFLRVDGAQSRAEPWRREQLDKEFKQRLTLTKSDGGARIIRGFRLRAMFAFFPRQGTISRSQISRL